MSDRIGGANHGLTVTYLNGEVFETWKDDAFGDPHNSSYKYRLRFLVGGSMDMTT